MIDTVRADNDGPMLGPLSVEKIDSNNFQEVKKNIESVLVALDKTNTSEGLEKFEELCKKFSLSAFNFQISRQKVQQLKVLEPIFIKESVQVVDL